MLHLYSHSSGEGRGHEEMDEDFDKDTELDKPDNNDLDMSDREDMAIDRDDSDENDDGQGRPNIMSHGEDITIGTSDDKEQDDFNDGSDDHSSKIYTGNDDRGMDKDDEMKENGNANNADRYGNDLEDHGKTKWNGKEDKNDEGKSGHARGPKGSQYRATSGGYQSNANLACTCIGTIICLLFRA